MLKQIIELLQMEDHYGQSETIEIAKGKYELPTTWKIGKRQIKRQIQWLKLKQ